MGAVADVVVVSFLSRSHSAGKGRPSSRMIANRPEVKCMVMMHR
jgi:hypothetical protein